MAERTPSAQRLTRCGAHSPVSVTERAGERLYAYADVQRQVQRASAAAQRSVETAGLFAPEVSPLAKSRASRYRDVPVPAATHAAAQPPAPSPPRRRTSPPQWSKFFHRTTAHEARRAARQAERTLEAAEADLAACTFRPALVPTHTGGVPRVRSQVRPRPGRHPLVDTNMTGGGTAAREARWRSELASFEATMQALQDELSLLRLQ